ncbi:mRNA processing-related protein, putative [Babesia bigemina]|uniref:Pre-mRNA-splicing factor SLU7 n=1 Tax=Babesia bigemina TaxID=5866 RepID=A0A061D4Q7_BABBI|nr:mRNA processing-related protein, putative [Babesia bigemina]CDR95032.1 mRNA processing-related protein, putative [Babesia bigemina]|eukprot:XP_012767218.1 mRNA processing-related protein, putative [Babesia bigemina]
MQGDSQPPRRDVRPNDAAEAAKAAADGDASRTDDNREVNPHIPRFIAKAPWYMNATPGLQHQRAYEQRRQHLDAPSQKGVTSHVAIKYRKNACENCGAITHDAKSCVERPRKKGAKYTNSNICPDEFIVQNTATGYEAVRDRWAGFDPASHQLLVEAHQAVEEEQERLQMQQLAAKLKSQTAETDESPRGNEKDEFADSEATFGTTDDRTRTTTRNLRIREDTAKYLINLNVDSAFYDPKSRSLRDDPLIGMENTGQHTFRGDNEIFTSGDAHKLKEMEQFAWEVQQKGSAVKFMAQPTELEFMYKKDSEKRQKEKSVQRQALLERYGGSEFLGGPDAAGGEPPADPSGDPPQSSESNYTRVYALSAYKEDVYTLGHTTIWGSYYDRDSKKWGYRCCKSTCRDSPCT